MTPTTRTRLQQAWIVTIFVLAAGCLLIPVLLMLTGCAAGSTSEITPATSAATDKTLRFTPESSKRSSTRVKITLPQAAAMSATLEREGR